LRSAPIVGGILASMGIIASMLRTLSYLAEAICARSCVSRSKEGLEDSQDVPSCSESRPSVDTALLNYAKGDVSTDSNVSESSGMASSQIGSPTGMPPTEDQASQDVVADLPDRLEEFMGRDVLVGVAGAPMKSTDCTSPLQQPDLDWASIDTSCRAGDETPEVAVFRVVCPSTGLGEVVAVIGADPLLGAWDIARAVRLAADVASFPIWMAEICLPKAGSEFKLLMIGADGSVQWEPMAGNRVWPSDLSACRTPIFGLR